MLQEGVLSCNYRGKNYVAEEEIRPAYGRDSIAMEGMAVLQGSNEGQVQSKVLHIKHIDVETLAYIQMHVASKRCDCKLDISALLVASY